MCALPLMNKYALGSSECVCAGAGFNNIQMFGVCFRCQECLTAVNIYADVFNGRLNFMERSI